MILTAQIICLFLLTLTGWITFRKFPLKITVKPLIQVSLLLVMALVLSYFSLMVGVFGFPSLKIGISQVPLILIGLVYGPSYGFIAGLAYDVLGLIVTPTDLPFLGFTLGNVLVCVIPGWIMAKNRNLSFEKVRAAVLAGCVLFSVILIESILIMKENFPFAMSETERTAVCVLSGIYPVLMFLVFLWIRKKSSAALADTGILLSVLAVDAGINLFLNPLWLQIMYGIPYLGSFVLRIVKLLVVVPVDLTLVTILYRIGKRFWKG